MAASFHASLTLLLSAQLAFSSIQFYNRRMSEPFKLYRLQQIDSKLDQIQKRLQEIEERLSDDKELQAAARKKDLADADMQNVAKELKRSEDDVSAQQIKIDKNQNRLYSGKVINPKELQDLQLESEAFQRNFENLENIQLEKMMNFETRQQELSQSNEFLEEINMKVSMKNANLVKEKTELNEDVQQLNVDREGSLKTISQEDLNLYEKLRAKSNGVAVAMVNAKSCAACGTSLPAALAQAARSPNKISRCSTCGRILYSG